MFGKMHGPAQLLFRLSELFLKYMAHICLNGCFVTRSFYFDLVGYSLNMCHKDV